MNNNRILLFIIAVTLILFAVFSRLLPHPMNFTPIIAVALFSAVYLDKKFAFIIPFAALLISDFFIGFYSGIYWVYGSFAVISLLGLWLKNKSESAKTLSKFSYIYGTALVSSIVFFIITNFGVWISGYLYEMNLNGLITCYTMAIPFFRNAVVGDIFYVTALFGLYELALKYFVKPQLQQSEINK
jgi:hypothetical protein